MKKIIIVSVIIGGLTYLTTLCATPEYRGLQLKVSRSVVGFVQYQNIIGLIITLYVIAITKEFIHHKLWTRYTTLWNSIKTTFLLLTAPILPISLIYNYKE
jgi:hypothetical protein